MDRKVRPYERKARPLDVDGARNIQQEHANLMNIVYENVLAYVNAVIQSTLRAAPGKVPIYIRIPAAMNEMPRYDLRLVTEYVKRRLIRRGFSVRVAGMGQIRVWWEF